MNDPLNTEEGFCNELAKVVCNKTVVEACYLADADSLEASTDQCQELAARKSFCNPNDQDYDRSAAKACLDAIKAMYSDARLDKDEIADSREACLGALHGSLGANQPCAVDEECDGSEDLRCVAKPAAQGTCQVPTEVAPAADCSVASAVCPDELYCDAGEHCVARQDAGDDCSETMLCVSTTQCVATVCVNKAANGQSCTADNECLGGFCLIKSGEALGQCGSFLPLTFDSAACVPLTP